MTEAESAVREGAGSRAEAPASRAGRDGTSHPTPPVVAGRPQGHRAPFRLGHRPELDGLRGVAVLLVVVYHLDTMWPDAGDALPGGYLGVDLFLVLSGFLITALLIGEHGVKGAVDLRAFLRRRGLRIIPALVALLSAATVLAVVDRWVVGRSIYDTHELVSTSAWSLTFAGNWAIVVDQGLEPLGHLWSISLEAQFYALWALSLVVALRSRRPYVVAGAMALSGVALVAAWRWVSYASHPDDVFAHYVSAFTRLDAPLIGAVAGICVARGWTRRIDGWAADICLIAGLGVLIWAAATAEPFEPALFRGGFTLVALAAALAVVGSVHGGRRGAARVLRSRPLVAAGRVSYSLYLWHVPVFVLVGREAATRSQPVRCLLGLVLAGTLSWVSYRYVEQPFLRRKGGRAPERTSGTVTSPAVAS